MLPLTLGPLAPPGHTVLRSGVRWLVEDGADCRPGDWLAYCGVMARDTTGGAQPFADEDGELQAVLVSPAAGRLRRSEHSSQGGFLDKLEFSLLWTPDFVIGHLEGASGEGQVRLVMLAGRRRFTFAQRRTGLLAGVYNRSRAWWGEGAARRGALLGIGVCDQSGVIRGEALNFAEIVQASPGPAQVIYADEEPLVASARVNIESLTRTPEDFGAIAQDLSAGMLSGATTPDDVSFAFASGLLGALARSPLSEPPPILTRTAVEAGKGPDAVLLSVVSEARMVLRHRRLGYHLRIHNFRLAKAGAAVRAWLRAHFEPVFLTVDDIRRDYETLAAMLAAQGTRVLLLNAMGTDGYERIQSYAPMGEPLAAFSNTVRLKELNLMACDLSRSCGVALVDLDAIAVELGAQGHIPDGIHQSGTLEREVRGELIHVLRRLQIPGF